MRDDPFKFGAAEGIITYPGDDNSLSWKDDNFLIDMRFTSGKFPFSVKITIKNTVNNLTSILQYTTLTNHILFDLRDNIIDILDDSRKVTPVIVSIEVPSHAFNLFTFNLIIHNGKSFLSKPHGTSNVILLHNTDELNTVEFFSQIPSVYTIGNLTDTTNGFTTVDLSSIITNEGEYNLCMEPEDAATLPPVIEYITDLALTPYSTDITWKAREQDTGGDYHGGLWDKTIKDSKCLKIIYQEPCENYPAVELKYQNCDGCDRYVLGKLLQESDKNSYSRITNFNYEIRNVNNFYTKENSKTLRVGFKDIPEGLEFNDIVYSPTLHIRDWKGEWIPCVLNDFSQTYNNEENNIILEVIVNKL